MDRDQRTVDIRIGLITTMQKEANKRLHDANLLDCHPDRKSDSASIISILGFEVLLKCAIYIDTGNLRQGHEYWKLWKKLSPTAQQEILQVAKKRSHLADLTNLEKLLKNYERVFIQGRYYYELYKDATLVERREAGEKWVKDGAKIEDAQLQHYPEELFCLNEALNSYIADNLAVSAPDRTL